MSPRRTPRQALDDHERARSAAATVAALPPWHIALNDAISRTARRTGWAPHALRAAILARHDLTAIERAHRLAGPDGIEALIHDTRRASRR